MRKSIRSILSLCLCALLAGGCLLPAFAVTLGDVTNDEEITAEDARAILRAAVGLDALSQEETKKADMDADGGITAADARLALRTAVGLNLTAHAVYENQYDILRSGTYYLELAISDGDGVTLSCAVDGDKKYVSGGMGEMGLDFSFYTENGELWFINEKYGVYTKLDAESLAFLGEDAGFLDEFSDVTDQIGDFGDLKPLEEADHSQADTFDEQACTSYWFMSADGTVKIYMDGAKLIGLVRVDPQGRVTSSAAFSAVNAVLPASAFDFRETYTAISDIITFMMIAYGEALGGDMISPEEIRQLIEEAKRQG